MTYTAPGGTLASQSASNGKTLGVLSSGGMLGGLGKRSVPDIAELPSALGRRFVADVTTLPMLTRSQSVATTATASTVSYQSQAGNNSKTYAVASGAFGTFNRRSMAVVFITGPRRTRKRVFCGTLL